MHSNLIRDCVSQALAKLNFHSEIPSIDIPSDTSFGDYSTNIALTLAKKLRRNPRDLAQAIIDALPPNEFIESSSIAGPGFINFTLQADVLFKSLNSKTPILNTVYSSKQITVEFTDPNPFKEFHIGHLYSNAIGESVARLLEVGGANVRRACYQGDVGIHVACSVWGMMKINQSANSNNYSEFLADKEVLSLEERVKWLGQCYAYGATQYKENPEAQQEIKGLNAQIFLAAQSMWKRMRPDIEPKVNYSRLISKEMFPQELVQQYYEKGRQWTLDYFETIYKKLGTKFEDYYFESFVGELGYELVTEHVDDGIFEKSDGAIVFKGEKYGLHTRVFVNALGLPTYEAKEMGLNPTKYKDHPFDISFIVTANEIDEYFKVVLKAMSLVSPDVASKTRHLSHGVVRLPEGKMSSRTGKVISGDMLLNEVNSRINEMMKTNQYIKNDKKEETVQKIAVAAVKYAFLRASFSKDKIFNIEESLSLNGNSGPYLLYTIVRCKSILEKVEISDSSTKAISVHSLSNIEIDLPVLRHLAHYHDILESAITQCAPHLICTYLHELAQLFNSFYDKAPILKAESNTKTYRLLIVKKVLETMVHGIHTLGFEEVEKM